MRKTFTYRSASAFAALALAGASATACSSGEQDSAGPSATGPNSDSSVLATTSVWADVAAAVTGAQVEAIISGTDIDPHHFEPSAKDLARVREADTLVANGGPYDASLYTVAEQDRIISAIPLVSKEEAEAHSHEHEHAHGDGENHGHDHDHSHDHDSTPGNLDDLEHAWFSTEKVKQVASALKEKVGGSTEDVDTRMDAVNQKLAELPHTHVAMTEPIAAPLVWGTELHEITPEGYMRSAINEADPSVQDVAAFLDEIKAGHIDILIANPQSTNSATEQLTNAARENNVAIVEMRETPPEGVNFLDYFDQVVDQLVDAVNSLPQDGNDDTHDHGDPHYDEEHAA